MSIAIMQTRTLDLPIQPAEWPLVDQETRALLRPANGIYTVAQAEAVDKIARARWFLLQNRGPRGYAWRCSRCHRIHDYFTLHCLELPMNGLTQVIGLLKERLDVDLVFSAVELGAIQPITFAEAKQKYKALRDVGYQAQALLGVDPRQRAQYSASQKLELLGLSVARFAQFSPQQQALLLG